MESMVVFYPCLDLEETTKFYTQELGLKLAFDQGRCRIFDSSYGYLGFVQSDSGKLADPVCISFNLKDEETVRMQYKKALEAGWKIQKVPQKHAQFPVYSFFIEDPNGYTVEFQKILIGKVDEK